MRSQWKTFVALVVLASGANRGFGHTRESGDVATALIELNQGNILAAISELKRVAQESSAPQAYFYLSGIYTEMGRYDAAFRYLRSAIHANPAQGAYYLQLGLIRRAEGCRPEAIAAFSDALQMGMGNQEATAWRQLGDAHMDLSQWDKAADAYHNALRLRPDDAESRMALGKLYLDRNDSAKAISELRAAFDIMPALPGLHAALGRAYRAAEDPASAIAILTKGIERDPADQEARYILAQTLLAEGRTNEGRKALEEYRSVQNRIAQTNASFEVAVGYAQAGDLTGAERILKDVLRLAPHYSSAHQILGSVLLNRGNLQPALEEFRQALAANPLNPETYFTTGTIYLRTAKLDDAMVATQRALAIDDEDARFYLQLGEIYSRMNRKDQSRDAVAKAAQLKSEPGYHAAEPYSSEGRRRDDAATVRRICSEPSLP